MTSIFTTSVRFGDAGVGNSSAPRRSDERLNSKRDDHDKDDDDKDDDDDDDNKDDDDDDKEDDDEDDKKKKKPYVTSIDDFRHGKAAAPAQGSPTSTSIKEVAPSEPTATAASPLSYHGEVIKYRVQKTGYYCVGVCLLAVLWVALRTNADVASPSWLTGRHCPRHPSLNTR